MIDGIGAFSDLGINNKQINTAKEVFIFLHPRLGISKCLLNPPINLVYINLVKNYI